MLSCAEVIAELASYLDNEVSPEARRDLEAHISDCKTCRVIYDSSRKTLRIVTEARTYELPTGFADRIMSRLKDHPGTGEL